MSDIIELVVNLREMVSSGVHQMGSTVHTTLNGIDQSTNNTQNRLNDLSRPVRINIDTRGLDAARASIEKTNTEMGLLKTSGAMFLGSMGSQLATRGATALYGLGSNILSSGMQAGATKMQFGVLAGKQEGAQLYGDLRKYVQESIFGPELYQNAKQMMAFGIAAKNVMPDIKMLGDVAMGDKQRMDQLTLAFSQTTSAGKLMGQDLLQYVAAGFNPLNEISLKTHKSMSDLRDAMSEGKISADMIHDAFVQATSAGGKFHGMLDEMSKTPFGKWQAITGSIQDAIMSLGSSLDTPLNKLFDDMQRDVQLLPDMVQRIAPVADHILMTFEGIYKWTSKNTDTISTYIHWIEFGAKAYLVWKVGTVAITAANWLWVASIGAQTAGTIEATSAIGLQNAELLEQEVIVDKLSLEWLALSKAQLASIDAGVAAAAKMPMINMTGVAAGANGAAAGLAGGAAGVLSSAAVPVFIAYLAGEAVSQLARTFLPDSYIAKKEDGTAIEWWNAPEYIRKLERDYQQDLQARKYLPGIRNASDIANMFNTRVDGVKFPYADPYGLKPGKDINMRADATDATDNITSGGKKQLIINLYSPLIGKQEYKVGTMKEAQEISIREQEESLIEMLQGAASTIYG